MPDMTAETLQPLVDIGGWVGFVVLVVLAMMRGWLVPGRQVDRLVAAYDRLIADKDQQIGRLWEITRTEAARGDLLALNQEKTMSLLRGMAASPAAGGER